MALYIHVPFCITKCHYCAFYSVTNGTELVEDYLLKICEDIKQYVHKYKDRITTIFIGGGNPTSIGCKQLEKIINTLLNTLDINLLEEFSIESNPETITEELITLFHRIPKFRLSLGIQRLDDTELNTLGRAGNMRHITDILDMLLPEISNISADFIIGVPRCSDITVNLRKFLRQYQFKHISAYFLTVEDGTILHKNIECGSFPSPDDIGPEEMFNIRDTLVEFGFEHYEISNYSKKGYQCKHNLHYWKQNEYIGLGPSAVGTINGKRVMQQSNLTAWLSGQKPDIEELTIIDKRNEFVMLGLRLVTSGLDLNALTKLYGTQSKLFNDNIQNNIKEGFLNRQNNFIKLTDKGIAFSNTVIGQLFER